MKKALSLILSLVMVLTLISMSALPTFAEGETTVSEKPVVNVYNDTVSTEDSTGVLFTDLFGSSNKLKANTVYLLKEDINLDGSGKNTGGNYVYFQDGSVLDGNGHSIHGIYLAGKSDRTIFYVSTDNITIEVRNISFGTKEDPITFAPTGETTTGTAKGFSLFWSTNGSTNLTFTNVTAHVDAALNAGSWQEHSVFVARNWGNTTFNNCVTYGTIDSANGFVGSFIGGTYNGKVVFNNCENNINYTNTSTQCFGGFVGYGVISNNSTPVIEFNNCVNNGNFTGGARQVGGFVGNFVSNGNTLTFNNCVNNGNIDIVTSAGTHVIGQGGFVGTVGATGTAGNVLIENCVNEGNITGDVGCGGFIGTFKGTTATVNNCVNNGDISCAGRTGGVMGMIYPNTAITVDTYVNNGTIYNEWTHAGSVFGAVAGSNESNTDVYDITMNNVLNTGEIKSGNPGSLSGYLAYATLTVNNCVNVGALTATGGGAVYAFLNIHANGVINSDSTADNTTNLYTGTYAAGLLKTGMSKSVTLDEVVAALNANTDMVSAFGRFTSNSNGTSVVVATPQYQGYQMGKIDENGKYTVRFLATINDVKLADPCEYTVLGMEFGRMVDGEFELVKYKNVACVYMSVIANENGVQRAYTAEELGGSYIYAVIGEGFDASKDLNIAIRTYAEDADEVRYYGETYSITIPAQVK